MGDKYIANPTTIGERLRNKRLELGLLQKEIAKQTGVTEEMVMLWENNHSVPRISQLPKVIQFLGYNPIGVDTSTLGGQIYSYRIKHGFSYKKMGRLLEVHASTVSAWEKGEHKPHGERLEKLQQLLQITLSG